MQSGNVFVISAPSGAGKSSLVKALCDKDPKIKLSISHTTRNKRPGDLHGVHYYFVSKTEFEAMLNEQEFLEHAIVYDNHYGTHKDTINNLIQNGDDIILEIDWQGARQVRKLLPEATLIFILPPSLNELENRLKNRKTDSNENINKRLNEASKEIAYAKYFDYAIINDDFSIALHHLYSIILVQRLKTKHVLELLPHLIGI